LKLPKCIKCDRRTDNGLYCRICISSKSKAVTHLSNISIEDNYGTPKKFLQAAFLKYDIHPIVDVCATQKNTKCRQYYTIKNSALHKEWKGPFFMNPPYSQISLFMAKAYAQHKLNNLDGMILTYSKTDTKWWHDYVEGKAEIHFIKGRIKFLDSENHLTKYSAPYPSCFLIYRSVKK